jgi:hypothetical protein
VRRSSSFEEDVMATLHLPHPQLPPRTAEAPPVARFFLHFAQMCMVMCGGALLLGGSLFGAAALLGWTDVLADAPVLAAAVVAISLSLPMAAFMSRMGMDRRATLEMSLPPLAVGAVLVVGFAADVVERAALIEVQTALACPVMLAVMLLRFRLYSTQHDRHHAEHRA